MNIRCHLPLFRDLPCAEFTVFPEFRRISISTKLAVSVVVC